MLLSVHIKLCYTDMVLTTAFLLIRSLPISRLDRNGGWQLQSRDGTGRRDAAQLPEGCCYRCCQWRQVSINELQRWKLQQCERCGPAATAGTTVRGRSSSARRWRVSRYCRRQQKHLASWHIATGLIADTELLKSQKESYTLRWNRYGRRNV